MCPELKEIKKYKNLLIEVGKALETPAKFESGKHRQEHRTRSVRRNASRQVRHSLYAVASVVVTVLNIDDVSEAHKQWKNAVITNRQAEPSQLQRTLNGFAAAIQNMSVDHRRRNISMSQQLLNGADVVASLQQMCRKAMPKRVATRRFVNTRCSDRVFDCALQHRLSEVVTLLSIAARIN